MADRKRDMPMGVEQRIFVDLVREQDKRMGEYRRRGEPMLDAVMYANALVEERHHITKVDRDRIVRHGVDRGWLDLVDDSPILNGVANGKPE